MDAEANNQGSDLCCLLLACANYAELEGEPK
jgi:hypothetical protein